jgi:hypothetical protein
MIEKFYLKKSFFNTFAKCPPSLTSGTDGNDRFGFISNKPFLNVNKLLITSNKSAVVLTGKKRLRGTLIPIAPSKLLIPAPDAVSN